MRTDRSGERRITVVEAPRASLGIKAHERIVCTIRSEIWGKVVALNRVVPCDAKLEAYET